MIINDAHIRSYVVTCSNKTIFSSLNIHVYLLLQSGWLHASRIALTGCYLGAANRRTIKYQLLELRPFSGVSWLAFDEPSNPSCKL